MLTFVAAGCLGAAIFAFTRALLARPSVTASRLAQVGGEVPATATRLGDRVVRPLVAEVVHAAAALLPARLVRLMEARLAAAGQPLSLANFLALLILSPVVQMAVVAPSLRGAEHGALLTIACGLLGVGAPIVWLSGRVTRRQRALDRALPDVLDLVVVSVEAGLGLEGAFERIVERGDGPLNEELRRVLADVNLGVGRRRAFQGLAARTGVPAIVALVTALLQAEQTGMGIAQVLRAQAEHLRVERRQRAEEAAMKAPLKMLFPLVFLIFPALFVVVLGPAVLELMRAMRG